MIEGYCATEIEEVRSVWRAACALSLSYTGLGAIGLENRPNRAPQKFGSTRYGLVYPRLLESFTI